MKRMWPSPWMTAALALCLWIFLSAPADAALTYSLSSPLKKDACANDFDSDCLDNYEETNLAWAVSPWYFYDEDEDCSGWTNKYGLPSVHFARQDFFQVRPQAVGIRNWSPTDGQAKWVAITYFLLFPHDCGNNFWYLGLDVAGHQGDSESIRFHLYSYDLRTWYLSYAYYWHHGRVDYVAGSFLESEARQLGTSWASVAADEDKHGSWPGVDPGSSHCAGSMDDFCFSTCDCFIGTWGSDFRNGYFEYPSANRNVGGPSPEGWISSVVTVVGADAFSELNIGHGVNREYWTPRSDQYRKFCGWECPNGYRASNGTCLASVHNETDCPDPLSSKVDPYQFNLETPPPPPPTSCDGYCGTYTGACWCDAQCVQAGDCCGDACLVCGYCGGGELAKTLTWKDLEGLLEVESEPPEARAKSSTVAEADPDPQRADRARRLAADAMARLRSQAGLHPADDFGRWLLRRAGDPVAALVPMLLDAPRERQLETLRWLLTVPERVRLASLFDDLRDPPGASRAQRERQGHERVLDLIAMLEEDGVRAPHPPAGPPLARSDAAAPPPNLYPPGGVR